MTGDRAADKALVRRLAGATGLLARLTGRGRKPLRLVAVPRDHVAGDRARGEQILAGRFTHGEAMAGLAALDFATVNLDTAIGRALHGFSWLRDLAAAAGRERGSRVAEALASRWLIAHGETVDEAWAPELWGERLLYWLAYAPYLLSSTDTDYRAALLRTIARAARHLEQEADKAPPGLPRITAWAGVLAASLVLTGKMPSIARGEGGLGRALAAAQHDDGGLMSRSPDEQALLVDRLGLLRAAYVAAKQPLPGALEDASAAAIAALHGVTMGDGALGSWQGGNPGEAARLTALVEGNGARARPLRAARGWGYQRLSALGTIVVMDAAPPPAATMAARGSASTLAFEMSDGAQRLVVNCGGPGLLSTSLPTELLTGLRSTAAHSTLVLDDSNSTAILDGGVLGKGVADVVVDRGEDNDHSWIEASHDGYQRSLGLTHERRLVLGNDGKELVGVDRLTPKGRKKIREAVPFAIRFHLAPGIEATMTADGMGALLRPVGAPPWSFRVRGAQISLEESLFVRADGLPVPTQQIAVVGDVSAHGGEFSWQFRRSS